MRSTLRLGMAACPEPAVDQGDPFLLEVPEAVRGDQDHRFYVYVSAPGFVVYGSNSIAEGWRRLGESLPGHGIERWCWAPCVRYVPGLARPWVMLYSMAAGAGDPDGHRNHQIRRADSDSPAGPFRDSGEVLTPDLEFAIDPDVAVFVDGSTRLTFAADFVDDEPLGTGLMQAHISTDLRRLESAPRVVARPSAPWHLYDPHRSMPWKAIAGIDWTTGATVRWSTIEGPATVRTPGGRDLLLYSGGNFADVYGVGVLAGDGTGWLNVSDSPDTQLLGPLPEYQLLGPGHCSVLTSAGDWYLCYHFRSEPQAPRQFAVTQLLWNLDTDLPYLDAAGAA